jgi:sialate O-acetylesterase
MKKSLCLAFLLLAQSIPVHAELKLAALFSDNMVLQQDMPVPVWGTGCAGEQVTVEFAGQKKSAKAGPTGRWQLKLDPLAASSEPRELKVTTDGPQSEIRKLSGVLVGEVWICSGQSNMERQLGPREGQKPLDNWEQEAASANYPLIRHFAVARKGTDAPLADTAGKWDVCSPATAPNFTAVGYYFGRDLHKKLNVPIGLIHTSWGGTPAEAWTSHEVLEQSLPEIFDAQRKAVDAYPALLEKYKQDEPKLLADWEKAAQAAKDAGKPLPRKPAPPHDPVTGSNRPANLYNGMIAPLIPYAIRGVIWYQGESNSGQGKQYQTLFPLMIADWRAQWKQGVFPFLFVQIAPYKKMTPEIREAQLLTWEKMPNTAMVVTADVGDAEDIHPTHKEPVGARLALAARALAYGEKIEYSGPVFKSMKVEGNRAILSFTHVDSGLVAKDGELKGFTIAGTNKNFFPAKAEILDDTVVVSSEQVSAPVAVRYGWANVPDVNLFNREGLPATPFRTD